MSFYTGTQSELLYSNITDATALATFTTEDNLQKTWPPVIIPAGFFYNNAATGKSLRIKAAGVCGSTNPGPTFTLSIRLLTSTTWAAGGILLGASPAVTMTVSITAAWWFLDFNVILRLVSIGAASSVSSIGEWRCPLGFVSPFATSIPASNTSAVVSSIDNTTQYYLFLSCACGTSNAANTITARMLKVWGDN